MFAKPPMKIDEPSDALHVGEIVANPLPPPQKVNASLVLEGNILSSPICKL